MTMLPPDPVYIFKGDMDCVSSVCFNVTPTTEFLYAGTQSGNVHVWSLKSKREVGRLKAGEDTCLSVVASQEAATLITHTKMGDVTFWKEEDSSWVATREIKTDFFGFCKAQSFEGSLYAPLKGCACLVISLQTGETTNKLQLTDASNLGELMAFRVNSLDGKKLLLGAYEGQKLLLWEEDTGKKLSELELEACPMAVDFHASTRRGVCGDPTDHLFVFSLDRSLELRPERKVRLMNAGVASVRVRPDGKVLAVGCWDGKLRLYSWKTLVLLAVLDTHSGTVEDVAFSENHAEGPRGRFLLAAASKDSRVSLWDLYNS